MILVGNKTISDVRVGRRDVSAVYVGSRMVWERDSWPKIFEYDKQGTYLIQPPQGARYMSALLVGGGMFGTDGDSGRGVPGRGGEGGRVGISARIEIGSGQIKIVVGKGGEGRSGGDYTTMHWQGSPFAGASGSLFSRDLRGYPAVTADGFGPIDIPPSLYPHQGGAGMIRQETLNGELYWVIGRGGQAPGEDGSVGGGGAGGGAGPDGRWLPGGRGGDGYARIVFEKE